jgi:cell division transport system permease protein
VIRFVLFSVGRAWQGFWRNAVMSFAATGTMVLMLLLLSGFWIVQTGLLAGLEFIEQKVQVVADLDNDVTADRLSALIERVEAMPEVATVAHVSREQALQRFRDARAARGEEDLTPYLETNPLHASLEITLNDPSRFGQVLDRLRAEPDVIRVKDIADLVGRVLTVTDVLRTGGALVLLVIGLIVLFIIVNTIRLAVVARAEEIEIMRLVGASDAFIRWPFIFEGALVGLLAACITMGILVGASEPIARFMFDFFRVLPLRVDSIARDVGLLVVTTGVGLGVAGSWMSVRAYLLR